MIYKVTRTKADRKNSKGSAKANRDTENCALVILGVDSGKSSIMSKLKIMEKGPGYCHFPLDEDKGYDQVYFKGLISEKVVYVQQKGRKVPQWKKVVDSARNEPLDMRNYAYAALKLLNVDFDLLEKRHKELQDSSKTPSKTVVKPPPKRRGCISKGVEL